MIPTHRRGFLTRLVVLSLAPAITPALAAPAAVIPLARNVGRGMSSPIYHIDECMFFEPNYRPRGESIDWDNIPDVANFYPPSYHL